MFCREVSTINHWAFFFFFFGAIAVDLDVMPINGKLYILSIQTFNIMWFFMVLCGSQDFTSWQHGWGEKALLHLLLRAGSATASCLGPCPVKPWASLRLETLAPLGNPCQCLAILSVNKYLIVLQQNFLRSILYPLHLDPSLHIAENSLARFSLLLPLGVYTHW